MVFSFEEGKFVCRDGNWTKILWAPAKNIHYG